MKSQLKATESIKKYKNKEIKSIIILSRNRSKVDKLSYSTVTWPICFSESLQDGALHTKCNLTEKKVNLENLGLNKLKLVLLDLQ